MSNHGPKKPVPAVASVPLTTPVPGAVVVQHSSVVPAAVLLSHSPAHVPPHAVPDEVHRTLLLSKNPVHRGHPPADSLHHISGGIAKKPHVRAALPSNRPGHDDHDTTRVVHKSEDGTVKVRKITKK
jgi:hypothetical protein